METKHTPGPWNWHADAIKGDPYNRVRYEVVTTGKTIARIYYSSYEGGPTNADADAHLIAAAPDLLAVLERASHINGFREFNDYLPTIRAAIAKATGA